MDRQVLKGPAMEFLLMNLPRRASGATYPDEYIERWASVYQANPALRMIGVPFGLFLAQPENWVRHVADPLREATEKALAPILAAAASKVKGFVEQLERDGDGCSNGRFVEKLKHRAHPRRGGRDFTPEREG